MIWTRRSFDKAFYENVEAMNQYNKENFNVAIDDRFRLNENLVWFKGEAQELERFYKTRIPRVTSFYNRNFYCRVNTGENKKAIYHYNIPNIITNIIIVKCIFIFFSLLNAVAIPEKAYLKLSINFLFFI